MELEIKYDCAGVDWRLVTETLKCVGMAYGEPDEQEKAFRNSWVTVFIYRAGQLIGFGRAISDGVFQAALYDVAVVPEYQRKGVGTMIIKAIVAKLPQCNIILYAAPGKEGFYEALRFRRMKTAMALFRKAEQMQTKGFTE